MSVDNEYNSIMLPTTSSLKPYVLLTALTEEDIKRLTCKNRSEQVLSNSHIQPVQIKQEPIDDPYNYQENVNNEIAEVRGVTQREEHSVVKIKTEGTSPTRIKTEVTSPTRIKTEVTSPTRIKTEVTSPKRIKTEVTSPKRIKTEVTSPPRIKTEVTLPTRIKTEVTSPTRIKTEVTSPKRIKTEVTSPPRIKTEVTSPERIKTEVTSPKRIKTEVTSSPRIKTEVTSPKRIKTEVTSPPRIKTEVTSPTRIKTEVTSSKRIKTEVTLPKRIKTEVTSPTRIKTEVTSPTRIKTEALKDYEPTIFNTPCTSNTDQISDIIQYKYDQCQAEFEDNELLIHKYFAHEAKPYICYTCNETFSLLIHLNNHQNNHRTEDQFGVKFRRFEKLNLSTDFQSSSRSNSALNYNYNNSNTFLQDSGTKNVPNKKVCVKKNMPEVSNCNNSFVPGNNEKITWNPYVLLTALTKEDIKRLTCKNRNEQVLHHRRGKISTNKSKRATLGLEPTKCNWCSKFITKRNLIRHINNYHPRVKPVKCSHCSMKFKNHTFKRLHVKNCHKN